MSKTVTGHPGQPPTHRGRTPDILDYDCPTAFVRRNIQDHSSSRLLEQADSGMRRVVPEAFEWQSYAGKCDTSYPCMADCLVHSMPRAAKCGKL